jgi:predicted ATP-grasp superfamily ATP-dependent carboligase
VVNDPAEVRNAPEKLYVLQYAKFMPPTLITRDVLAIREFREEFGDIILKPLYGNGGAGVFRLAHGDENFASLVELFTLSFREPFIAQRYLPTCERATSASSWWTASRWAPQPRAGGRRAPLEHAYRRAARTGRTHRPGPRPGYSGAP